MLPPRVDHEAARAAEQAMARIANGRPMSPEALTRLKGLPALLRTSGLPATLALFQAKSGSDPLGQAYRRVRHELVDQLRDELRWESESDLYTRLAKTSAADLGRAQLRLAAFAGWLRRLAEAEENSQRDRDRQAGRAGGQAGGGDA